METKRDDTGILRDFSGDWLVWLVAEVVVVGYRGRLPSFSYHASSKDRHGKLNLLHKREI